MADPPIGLTSQAVSERITPEQTPWSAPINDRRPLTRRTLVTVTTDVVLAIGVGVAVCSAIAFNTAFSPRPADWWAYTLGAAIGAISLARRRYPLATLLATACTLFLYYAFGYPGIEASVPMALALYSSAARGQWKWCTGVSVFFVLADVGTRGFHRDEAFLPMLPDLFEVAGLLLAVILLGETVRAQQERAVETRRRARAAEQERAQDLAHHIDAERLRIARDMHDIVGHTIAGITLQAGLAGDILDKDPDRAKECMAAIRRAGRAAVDDLSTSISMLRESSDSSSQSVTTGLDDLHRLISMARSSGLEVTVRQDNVRLPPVSDVAAYRIVQEALTNVIRHSGAGHALVQIRQSEATVRIEVRDDGRRRPLEPLRAGHGIVGMRERAAAIGGTLSAGHVPDGPGFRVSATLPLPVDDEDGSPE